MAGTYTSSPLSAQLDERRAKLRLSKAQLARRADISLPTVNRILSGTEQNPRMGTLAALAAAMGLEISLGATIRISETLAVEAFREAQARAKARRLVRLLQGSMALEAEALDLESLQRLEDKSTLALLHGPPRRLWSDMP